jgi:hypothetical protein
MDLYGSGEPAAPRRQSLLRSYLAARSFPRRPPAKGLRQPRLSDSPTHRAPRTGGVVRTSTLCAPGCAHSNALRPGCAHSRASRGLGRAHSRPSGHERADCQQSPGIDCLKARCVGLSASRGCRRGAAGSPDPYKSMTKVTGSPDPYNVAAEWPRALPNRNTYRQGTTKAPRQFPPTRTEVRRRSVLTLIGDATVGA